jgi:DNA-binding NarL/FixJ family response regulator
VRTEVGASEMPFFAPLLAQGKDLTRTALGAAKFEAEFEAGKRLDRHAAVDLALGKPAQAGGEAAAGAVGAPEPGTAPLAKREADVARLIADGFTNKQIGARLFISERTIDSHVRSILNKLGVSTRAQIAAWIASAENW